VSPAPTSRRYAAWLAAAASALLAAGCGNAGAAPDGQAAQEVVTVLAAASLTEPLTELAVQYEGAHAGVEVRLSFGSSTTLAQQVAAGAPADVVAFAGTNAVRLLPADAAAEGGSATIARNSMEIATPPDNPAKVAGVDDLANPEVDVALCAETVPCGQAADTVLDRAKVEAHVVSREIDVRATLAKVRLGEVDAAIVYHSDVASAGGTVRGVPIPDAVNTTLDYPLLWLNGRPHTVGFAELLTGPDGAKAFADNGFRVP
jgi:molybdate transport system substrate-binding protein